MRLAVFGATGGTGKQLLVQASAADHTIRALTRSPEKLSAQSEDIPIKGNVLDPISVARTVEGADAVVCLLGWTQNNPEDVVPRGTEPILDSMRQNAVRRLVVVISNGLG